MTGFDVLFFNDFLFLRQQNVCYLGIISCEIMKLSNYEIMNIKIHGIVDLR